MIDARRIKMQKPHCSITLPFMDSSVPDEHGSNVEESQNQQSPRGEQSGTLRTPLGQQLRSHYVGSIPLWCRLHVIRSEPIREEKNMVHTFPNIFFFQSSAPRKSRGRNGQNVVNPQHY